MKGNVEDILQNNLFHVLIDKKQQNYEIQEVEMIIKKRNLEHTKSLTLMKYVFFFATLITTFLYYKSVIILYKYIIF